MARHGPAAFKKETTMQREWKEIPTKELWEELRAKAIESLQDLEYDEENFQHFYTYTVKDIDRENNTCDGTSTAMASDGALFNLIIRLVDASHLEEDIMNFFLHRMEENIKRSAAFGEVKGNA